MSLPGVVVLDLSIEENKAQEGALQVLKVVRPDWSPENIVFKSYTEGITNKLLGCRLKDDSEYNDSILLRIFGQKTELIIDREIESLSMYILNKVGCAKPLYAQFENGLMYGFIAGECMGEDTCRDEHVGSLLAQEMVRVGAIDPSQQASGIVSSALKRLDDREPVLFKKTRKYIAEGPESFSEPERSEKLKRDIPSKDMLNAEADLLERELTQLGSPVVLCHNDILLKNVVFNKKEDRCYLIDYEYTGFSYQAFDIGNHFCEWAGIDEVDYNLYPDKPTQLVWLRHFLKAYKAQQGESDPTPTDKELEIIYVQCNKFALAAHFFWGVWALIQARYSTIDFDYLEYAKIRLDEYFRRKAEFLALVMPE